MIQNKKDWRMMSDKISEESHAFLQRKHLENLELLTRIDVNLANHLKNFDEYKKDFDQHKVDDTTNLQTINNRISKIEGDMRWYSGMIAGVIFLTNWLFRR